MKRLRTAFLLLLLSPTIALAQKDTATYYLNNQGGIAKNSAQSDYYVKFLTDSIVEHTALEHVIGFYKTGEKQFDTYTPTRHFPLKYQWHYTSWFKNGNKRSELTYNDGKQVGESIYYYPNGRLYNIKSTKITSTDTVLLLKECRDSTGKVLAINGRGLWIKFDNDFTHMSEKGDIENGREDGAWVTWTGDRKPINVYYKDGGELIDDTGNPAPLNVERIPEFPGGVTAFYKYLGENIIYPTFARQNNMEGRVIVQFVVERDGSLSDVHAVRGMGSGFDEEAVRVIKMCPKWIPGIQRGRTVRVQYSVPINFTLKRK